MLLSTNVCAELSAAPFYYIYNISLPGIIHILHDSTESMQILFALARISASLEKSLQFWLIDCTHAVVKAYRKLTSLSVFCVTEEEGPAGGSTVPSEEWQHCVWQGPGALPDAQLQGRSAVSVWKGQTVSNFSHFLSLSISLTQKVLFELSTWLLRTPYLQHGSKLLPIYYLIYIS